MSDQPPSHSESIRVDLLSLLPTPAGFAIFLRHGKKTGVIYIDPSVGVALPHLRPNLPPNSRPMTHDMIRLMMEGFGIKARNICITSIDDGIFRARLILQMQNEVSHMKIVELDVRSSDAMALARKLDIPLHITQEVWDSLEDVSPHYEKLHADAAKNGMIDLK